MRKSTLFSTFVLAVIIASIGQLSVPAYGQLKTSDIGHYVTAIVDPNNQGLITIRKYPGTNTDAILSYPQKSFATVMVGDRIFTNNHTGVNISNHPQFGGFLDNGISQKVGDTIKTTWTGKNGCDIIQEVYPVTLEASGQIVMRWKVKNNQPNTPIWGQAQFLLDLQVGEHVANDGAPILTRYGYRPIWEQYNDASTYGIPWFFAAFENKLPNPPTFDPGATGVGYNQDVNYKLGLKKPSVLTVGDWGTPIGGAMVDFLWGPPPSPPWGQPYADASILFQWDGVGIGGGKTIEVARTSYGTGEFGVCTGQLFGIVFYPRYFRWNKTQYEPNPGNIEFYAFDVYSPLPADPNFGPASANTYLKLHVGPNLHITKPDDAGLNATKTIQRQLAGPANGYIPQYGVGTAFWDIAADKAINCNGTIDSWLKFTAESSLSGTGGIFFNSGDADTCEHHLKIDCVEEDFLGPIVDNEQVKSTFPFEKSFDVHDDRLNPKDRGLDKVTWVAQPGSNTDVSNFTIVVNPPLTACSKLKHTYTVKQKDSTIGGCFDFVFVDCAGNDTAYSVCIPARPVTPTPDTLDPVITTVEHTPGDPAAPPCNGRCDSLLFTDNRQHDVGIESIAALPTPINMKLDVLNFPFGAPLVRGKVCVVDTMLNGSITIRVTDTLGHYTDSTYTYCTVEDTTGPDVKIVDDPIRRGHWTVFVTEILPWDRGIDTVRVVNPVNVDVNPPSGVPPAVIKVPPTYTTSFEVFIKDSTKDASFCVDAKDLRDGARNWSPRVCANAIADPDIMAPNIIAAPLPGPNVTKITVSINDYHTNSSGDTLGWDKGVDKVWFTSRGGFIFPDTIKVGCKMVVPPFVISVEDTLNVDSIACITIHALDCASNENTFEWCYPYNPDDLPPILRVGYNSRTQLTYRVADSGLYDRGLTLVTLKNEVNLSPVDLHLDQAPIVPTSTIDRAKYASSSSGTLEAVDYWGTLNVTPGVKLAHTATVDLGVWVQDLQMKKGQIVETSGQFELPISFIANDTFNLARKGIDEFEFTFTLSGDVDAVNFVGVRQPGTATETWNVATTKNNNTYTVHGTKTSQSLAKNNGETFIALVFDAIKNEFNKDVILSIDQKNGETVIYNNGTDRIVNGKNAIATLPAPYGTLSGSHIVIVGTCSPMLETSAPPPSIVTLEQNTPNPFSGNTSFTFSVKEDGMVKLAIYDLLGKPIETIVSSILPQGRYTVRLDGTHYGSGTYIARLQANGTVRSRTIRIER